MTRSRSRRRHPLLQQTSRTSLLALLLFVALIPTPVGMAQETGQAEYPQTHTVLRVQGWTILMHNELLTSRPEKAEMMMCLMEGQLHFVNQNVPSRALTQLKTVEIWVNPPYENEQPTAQYHGARRWLVNNGRDPAMAQAIEMTNIDKFEFEDTRMPCLMLHELAHAYHDQVFGYSDEKIRSAYETAKDSGIYDEVDRFDGRRIVKDKAYGMNNQMEYFAESTEAYFGRNDFYPFDHEELQQADPDMCELLGELWGVEK